jgi:hypothetical protein
MNFGFTGTQQGMTLDQKRMLRAFLLEAAYCNQFHHGCCVGADDDANEIVRPLGYQVTLHPPTDRKKVPEHLIRVLDDPELALDEGYTVLDPKPYLERNKEIVRASSLLIAAPKSSREEQRSGTWSTVRYARTLRKAIIIINPDGDVTGPYKRA